MCVCAKKKKYEKKWRTIKEEDEAHKINFLWNTYATSRALEHTHTNTHCIAHPSPRLYMNACVSLSLSLNELHFEKMSKHVVNN